MSYQIIYEERCPFHDCKNRKRCHRHDFDDKNNVLEYEKEYVLKYNTDSKSHVLPNYLENKKEKSNCLNFLVVLAFLTAIFTLIFVHILRHI